jgi:D-sedoheptulose 7-phosphate isomerase
MADAFPRNYKAALLEAIELIDLEKVEQAIRIFRLARDEERSIFVCGNGGSSAAASHFVCDMVKGASYGRPSRFRITALNDNLATLTAYANDCGYETVFEEQLKNFARPGDVFMALSGSGNSPNVVRAMKYASTIGCRTVALTGRDGGELGRIAQLNLHVAHPHMGRIEECHFVILHMICYRFMEEA